MEEEEEALEVTLRPGYMVLSGKEDQLEVKHECLDAKRHTHSLGEWQS